MAGVRWGIEMYLCDGGLFFCLRVVACCCGICVCLCDIIAQPRWLISSVRVGEMGQEEEGVTLVMCVCEYTVCKCVAVFV